MSLLIPIALLAGMLWAAAKRVPVYDAFVEGAEQGLRAALRVLPFLVAVMAGVGLVRASGLLDALEALLSPLLAWLGVPRGVTAMLLIRPLSGSAALSELQGVMARFGPDSAEGLAAAIMMGSTETVFYTISLYMSAAGMKKTGYAIPVSLITCAIGALAAGFFARMMTN